MSDVINLYWAPATFVPSEETWFYLYTTPEVKDNTITFKSNIDDHFGLPMEEIRKIQKGKVHQGRLECQTKLALFQPNKSEDDSYAQIVYNMNWYLFADAPVEATCNLDYTKTPVKNSTYVEEKVNLGKALLPLKLEYKISLQSKDFRIKVGDELLNVDIATDKEIKLHRFQPTSTIRKISNEYMSLSNRYDNNSETDTLYDRSMDADMHKILLHEINNNIIK